MQVLARWTATSVPSRSPPRGKTPHHAMASFTYTAWSNIPLDQLLDKLCDVFGKLGYSLINPASGKVHCWTDGEIPFDVSAAQLSREIKLPFGLQWWKSDDDLYVGFSQDRGGYLCRVTLYDMPRSEQAQLAKLLIEQIVPDKHVFPDDYDVFRLSAE